MRGILLSLAIVAGLAVLAPSTDLVPVGTATVTAADLAAQQPEKPELNVDVDIDRDGGGAWYMSPMWLAIGGLAVLVLILIVVFAARGSGTTVIKE